MPNKTLSNDVLKLLTTHDEYDFIPIDKIKQPFDGSICKENRFWYVVQDHVLIYIGKNKKSYSPHCNANKNVADHRFKQINEMFKGWDNRLELIEYAFVENKER